MSEGAPPLLPIAFIYGDPDASAHLRAAFNAFKADIVYDARVEALNQAALSDSGARVAVVNLDAEVERQLDAVYATLDECGCRVVFDDPGSSARLEGWEQARWARHLVAKLRDDRNVDPPRPLDAAPVDVAAAAVLSDAWLGDALEALRSDTEPDATDAEALTVAADMELGLDADFELTAAGAADGEPALVADASDAQASELAAATTDAASGDDVAALDTADDNDALSIDWSLLDDDVPAADAPLAERSDALLGEPMYAAVSGAAHTEAAVVRVAEASAEPALPDAAVAQAPATPDLPDKPVAEPAHAPAPPDADAGVPAERPDDAALPPESTDEPLLTDAARSDRAGPTNVEQPGAPLAERWGTADADGPEAKSREALAASLDLVDALDPAPDDVPPTLDEAGAAPGFGADADVMSDAAAIEAEPLAHQAEPVAEGLDELLTERRSSPNEPVEAGLVEAAASAPDEAGEPPAAALGEEPPPAQWALVDDSFGDAVADPFGLNEPQEASAANPMLSRDFDIELVDPIDYLAPDAPPPREVEVYSAPELMSMHDALKPQAMEAEPAADAATALLPRIVVMGASIGGPDAVREFLAALPSRFPALLVLAQHMGSEFIDLMVGQLNKAGALPVRVAVNGQRAVAGEVLVVPCGAQLAVARDGRLALTLASAGGGSEPVIAGTLTAAASEFGTDALAIVFSGMIDDIAAGGRAITEHGGEVWTQDAASCVVATMVEAAHDAGVVRFSGTPAALAQRLIEICAPEASA